MKDRRFNSIWVYNECGSEEYDGGTVSEEDIQHLACGSCGGWDFHLTKGILLLQKIRKRSKKKTS